jgi:fatty acid synthase subunit alpha, fungi type
MLSVQVFHCRLEICTTFTNISSPVTFSAAPKTEVTTKGDIVYSEVIRETVRKLEAYIEEMTSGDTISGSVNIQKVQDDVLKLWTVVKSQPGISQEQKSRIKALYEGVVRSVRKDIEPTRTHATLGLANDHLSFCVPTSLALRRSPLIKFPSSIFAWRALSSSKLFLVYLILLS